MLGRVEIVLGPGSRKILGELVALTNNVNTAKLEQKHSQQMYMPEKLLLEGAMESFVTLWPV